MLAGTKAAAGTGKPLVLKTVGDPDAAINAQGANVVRAEYICPNLSHSPLEPMNFTAWYQGNKMDLIGPTQWQDAAQASIAKAVGLDPATVSLQTTFLGGGFGRRIDIDFIIQAAQISKAVGKPVKLLWTREDDMTHDFYRPMSVHNIAAAVGPDGKPTAMTFRFTSQSITGRVFGLPAEVQDPLMTEAAIAPYEIPATRHDVVKHDAGLRVGYWRSVSHFQNAFANEGFIDELAMRGQGRSGGLSHVADRQVAALPERAEARRRQGGLGQRAAGGPLPRRGHHGGLRHLHGDGDRDLDEGRRAGGASRGRRRPTSAAWSTPTRSRRRSSRASSSA